MPDLYPVSFSALVDRLLREIRQGGEIYTLARRDIWVPDPDVDLSMQHLAGRAATPLGPASGPHTQMAQNIVMSFLGGARFMELKTVQVKDDLEIPRPCIFVPHIGYNVEWSQELLVKQSAQEYVAAWMLIHLLTSPLGPGLWPDGAGETIFDMSVGYDLAGIQSDKVRGFIDTLKDASALIEKLKASLPARLAHVAKLDFPSQVSSSTTLSTFHGCPAEEIESIAAHMLEEHGLHTVIKLNPTLLGYDRVRALLDAGGYDHIHLDRADFEKDLSWDQLMDFLPRLEQKAQARGLGFGVKFSNTLVCRSDEPPFDGGEMYLSGPPLHVLALTLADAFAEATGGRLPISFSAGVDPMNFRHLAACGLQPITTCSDILKGTGYARLPRYLRNLEADMKKVGAKDLPAYIAHRAQQVGGKTGASVLKAHAASVRDDVAFHYAKNSRLPKKIGSQLVLLDCITCDKCVKVCPNMANITVAVTPGEYTPGRVSWDGETFTTHEGERLVVAQKHQIGNVVDLCNRCGQCDPWCPEDGGPYLVKPHLFLDQTAFDDAGDLDGFCFLDDTLVWRNSGATYRYRPAGADAIFTTPTGTLTLRDDAVVASSGRGDVDLRIAVTMRLFFEGFSRPDHRTFLERPGLEPSN